MKKLGIILLFLLVSCRKDVIIENEYRTSTKCDGHEIYCDKVNNDNICTKWVHKCINKGG